MFRPNLSCTIQKASGKVDVYGMPEPGVKYVERCAVVRLKLTSEKSSVRADTSASRGNALEIEADVMFLLTKNTVAKINDMILFEGEKYRIASRFPRVDLQGKMDHYEVTCTYWSDR
jgi:hypothetical protein